MKTLRELQDLTGRRALLTGGAGHLGRAAAEALVECGAQVAVLDLQEEACQRRASELNALRPGAAWPLACDLLDEAATRAAAQAALARMGGLDILIHCAFYPGLPTDDPGRLETRTLAAWDRALRVNLTAAFVLVQECRTALAAQSRGSVILVSSIYGMGGAVMSLYEGTAMVNEPDYAASKGGLIQLGRYLATTLAPRIRVNTIAPGGLARGQPESFRQRYEARTPLGRMGREEDVKGAFAFLAGDQSAYVTGQNLAVDGGWSAW